MLRIKQDSRRHAVAMAYAQRLVQFAFLAHVTFAFLAIGSYDKGIIKPVPDFVFGALLLYQVFAVFFLTWLLEGGIQIPWMIFCLVPFVGPINYYKLNRWATEWFNLRGIRANWWGPGDDIQHIRKSLADDAKKAQIVKQTPSTDSKTDSKTDDRK